MPKLILPILLSFLAVSPLSATDLHVSLQGNDSWSGALPSPNALKTDGPLLTPLRALGRSRSLRQAAPQTPIRILFQTGKYYLSSPLVLAVVDSGLSLECAPGASATLTGGRPITGWKRKGDLWWAPVQEGWNFRWLSVDGSSRPRARLPKEGTFTHESRFDLQWKTTTGGEWGRPLTAEETGGLTYKEGDLGEWVDPKSAEVEVLHMWDESWTGVSSLDPKTRRITFTNRTTHPPGAFDVREYAVWNLKEGLTEPGQWRLDKTRREVWYRPLEGEDPTRLLIEAPVQTALIMIGGYKDLPVSMITIKGLVLEQTDTPVHNPWKGAVQMNNVADCRLENLQIRNLAGWGVQSMNATRVVVERCVFTDLGGGGAGVTGKDNRMENCTIRKIGLLFLGANGVTWQGTGGTIAHNEIEDTPYDGIMCQAGGALIEGNKIRRTMLKLHDGAAIYTGMCKGITIRGNDVRDVPDTGGYGSSAYYLDEQAENYLVEDNFSVGVARPMQNHMAKNNVVRGNLFVVEGDGVLAFARSSGYRLENNVLWASGRWSFQAPDEGVVAWPGNLIYSGTGNVVWTKLAVYNQVATTAWEVRDGSRFVDPGLADPLKGDFTLKPGSPALKKLKYSWLTAGIE